MDKLNGGQSRDGGQAISIRKYADEGQRKHGNGSNATWEPRLKAKYPNASYDRHEKTNTTSRMQNVNPLVSPKSSWSHKDSRRP